MTETSNPHFQEPQPGISAEDDQQLIHIVGMYKCGTSWLSNIFAAHPGAIAWREFDVIRSAMAETNLSKINRALAQIAGLFDLPYPRVTGIRLAPKTKKQTIRSMFCGEGWIPIMGEGARDVANSLDYNDSRVFIDSVMELADKNFAEAKRVLQCSEKFLRTLGPANSTQQELTCLLDAIKGSSDMQQVPLLFLSYLQRQCEPATRLVLKAADQLMYLDELERISPRSHKVAIIRDGRDVAISAFHFRQLMRKQEAPWVPRNRSYLQELRAWAVRARVLANYASNNAKQGQLIILRYEDLLRDFEGQCTELFQRLDMPVSKEVMTNIKQLTEFSAVSGGRKAGEAAEHIVRKGIAGEWKEALDSAEAEQAWRVAGQELKQWGYQIDGSYEPHFVGAIR